MEKKDNRLTVAATGCQCCVTELPEGAGARYGCEERRTVFTEREQKVLQRIRHVQERAAAIKRELDGLPEDAAGRRPLAGELDRLRAERQQLERERLAAAHERMQWLGHA
ncbi:MAG: hypothetical protein SWC40_06035 [Thermodesulfobacteriota bacterium]|nr:hypothetical protein [Thermodesulfobacteriota bacterium]